MRYTRPIWRCCAHAECPLVIAAHQLSIVSIFTLMAQSLKVAINCGYLPTATRAAYMVMPAAGRRGRRPVMVMVAHAYMQQVLHGK